MNGIKWDGTNWMCWICSDGARYSTYTGASEHERMIENGNR